MRALQYLTSPLARLLLSAIFIMSGGNKVLQWSQTADQMRDEGMVAVPLFLAGAIVFEIAGGLSVLLGLKARLGALILIVYLIPVTLIFHDFWQYQDQEQRMQMIHFMKNLAIMGGLFGLLTYGAGPVSIDGFRGKNDKKAEAK